MVVATWNVNSIVSRLSHVLRWLALRQPDVLCLQELKCLPNAFPLPAFWAAGYMAAWVAEGSYNGVAIVSRLPLTDVKIGFGDGRPEEARLIAATAGGVRVLSAYVPHGREVGSEWFRYKLDWLARLRAHLDRSHQPGEPLALCGDFNVAPEARDVYDPKLWGSKVHFHPDARIALKEVTSFGLADTFRMHHAGGGLYSWWDYTTRDGFAKNKGLRIDHVFATRPLAERCLYAAIDRTERTVAHSSDHAPVLAAFS